MLLGKWDKILLTLPYLVYFSFIGMSVIVGIKFVLVANSAVLSTLFLLLIPISYGTHINSIY